MAIKKPSFLSGSGEEKEPEFAGKAKGVVKLNLDIYKTIIAAMSRYSNPRIPEDEWIEAMGLLYGYNDGDDVIITECIPFTHTKKAGHILKVMFDEEDYALAADIETQFYTRDPPQFIVGWVHSHPGILVMMSQDDIKNQLAWQTNNPNAIAIVFNHQRLLRQIQMPKRKGDPVKQLTLDPGFKIFRLKDTSKGLESNYLEVDWDFTDYEFNEALLKNAKEFCLWVSKAFPRDDGVLTEYKDFIDRTLKKLEDIHNGTLNYIKTLIRKGEQNRIEEIVNQQYEDAEKIIENGNSMVQVFRMMPPYLEYKERDRLIPQINAVLNEWDEKTKGFLDKLKNLENMTEV